jgi:hypothetical protein
MKMKLKLIILFLNKNIDRWAWPWEKITLYKKWSFIWRFNWKKCCCVDSVERNVLLSLELKVWNIKLLTSCSRSYYSRNQYWSFKIFLIYLLLLFQWLLFMFSLISFCFYFNYLFDSSKSIMLKCYHVNWILSQHLSTVI